MPPLTPRASRLHWTNVTAFLGVGLLAMAFAVSRLRGKLRVPVEGSLPRRIAAVQAAMSSSTVTTRAARPAGRGRDRLRQDHRGRRRSRWSIFALGTVWAVAHPAARRPRRSRPQTGVPRRPPRSAKAEIGIVDQVPFAERPPPRRLAAPSRAARLNGYGWVDRRPRGSPTSRSRRRMDAVGDRRAARGSAAMKRRRCSRWRW